MTHVTTQAAATQSEPADLRTLTMLAVFSTCLYGVIALLSWRFEFDSPTTLRPIVPVLILFAMAFAGYLFAIRVARRARQDWRLVGLIVGTSFLFRVVLLFSVPIQEVDIYRYLWDGAVSTAGVSPFRFSPEQVRVAARESNPTDETLRRLVKLLDEQPVLADILERIHYGDLPTVYPPVSQLVFAAATRTTPNGVSLTGRVFIMKVWLIGFDLATLLVVVSLLRRCRQPVGLCLIYGWCPLLLKEVANSGHLDTIAVFLTTLAVYLGARLLMKQSQASIVNIASSAGVAVVLALAVGAKLYPVVLAPLLFYCSAKRVGWRQVLIPLATFVATTMVLLWPMFPHDRSGSPSPSDIALNGSPPTSSQPSTSTASSVPSDPSLGVTTFLRHWEMNDFIFLLLVENLKPTANLTPDRIAWFSVLPASVRQQFIAIVTFCFGLPAGEVPFLAARAMTAIVFVALAGWFAWRAGRTSDIASVCEASFLTLAWFWLLCPTQNPWYWTWALPLLPLARSRAWLAVSGLVFLYYLRFWLSYHWPETRVLGTPYFGNTFFDFVVTWFEFAPWFVWLAVDGYRANHARSGKSPATSHVASHSLPSRTM